MKKKKEETAVCPAPEPRQRPEKPVVIVDIDGTIAKPDPAKIALLHQDPPDYEGYHNMEFNEEPYPEMIRMIQALYDSGYDIVFCTSRSNSIREKTLNWIWKQFPDWWFVVLLMRPDGDERHDTELKPAIVRNYLRKGDFSEVAFVLEDRTSMVQKWRELGVMCLQVTNGDF